MLSRQCSDLFPENFIWNSQRESGQFWRGVEGYNVLFPREECEHEMFVLIQRNKRQLAVPLMQLEGIQVDEETRQAIEDWHYWVNRGYEL